MNQKTIYIAEDHKILRDGLKLILSSLPELNLIGEASDGRTALEEVLEKKPDLLLLDLSMPSMLGLDVARKVSEKHKSCRIIILTKHTNIEYLKQLLHYKIAAYVLKDDAATDLVQAIQSVLKERIYISPKISEKLKSPELTSILLDKRNSEKSLLTYRELEIVKLIAEDKTTDEVAEILKISSKTVKAHRSNIFRKLNITSVTELVKYAIQNNLVEL